MIAQNNLKVAGGAITSVILLSTLVTGLAIAQSPEEKVVLRIGVLKEPTTMNVFGSIDRWSNLAVLRIYETLFGSDPLTGELYPGVAENYVLAWTPGGENLIITVRLREDVNWHDGRPVTARDVKFTRDTYVEFGLPTYEPYSDFTVEVVDNHTLKLHFPRTIAGILEKALGFYRIVPEHIWEPWVLEAKRMPKADAKKHMLRPPPAEMMIGSGPFRFVEWVKGEYVRLAKVEPYWGAGQILRGREIGPYVDEILILPYKSLDALALAMMKGEIDYMFGESFLPAQAIELEAHPDIEVVRYPELGFTYIGLNHIYPPKIATLPPTWDNDFRIALATLIDKKFLVDTVLGGRGSPLDAIVPIATPRWHNPDVIRYGENLTRDERVARARGILENAGYTFKDGVLVSSPWGPVEPFDILVPPVEHSPTIATAAFFIAEWWKEAGIRTAVKPMALGGIYDASRKSEAPPYILSWRVITDPDSVYTFFHTKTIPFPNFVRYSNPEYDRVAENSRLHPEFEERKEWVFKAQEMIARDLPYIVLYSGEWIDAYRADRFEGWFLGPGGLGNELSYYTIKQVAPIPPPFPWGTIIAVAVIAVAAFLLILKKRR